MLTRIKFDFACHIFLSQLLSELWMVHLFDDLLDLLGDVAISVPYKQHILEEAEVLIFRHFCVGVCLVLFKIQLF